MSNEQYCKELSGVVALPDRCECSLMDFARRLRIAILHEQDKLHPDNILIGLLCDAARIGYEYGECAQDIKELAQQHLTGDNIPPSAPPSGEIKPNCTRCGGHLNCMWKIGSPDCLSNFRPV